jgi:SAM-dependent methyltransferase
MPAAVGEGMLDQVLKKIVWPLLGIALVITGCFAVYKNYESVIPYAMIGVGLFMVSFEKAGGIFNYSMELVNKFKDSLKELKEPEKEKGGASAGGDEVTSQGVLDEDAPPSDPDEWNRKLRPVLYQASHYSVPTYYLNPTLKVIDWNVAFELIFQDILGKIRNRHVNYFINELANKNQVFDHAREFTVKVRHGQLPLVDIEPLVYRSPKYGNAQGNVGFVKVATQLNDSKGVQQGWCVALMLQDINWGAFQTDLYEKVRADKLWSVYSASYDRILKRFPPYNKLIEDIVAVIPDDCNSVLDLGAGTGNVTNVLINKGLRVTAVENNIAMLEKLRERQFNPPLVTIVKASVEFLDSLEPKFREAFDAAVMVNVLYAIEDPLSCLQSVFRLLKPGGVLAFSTTHSETRLDPLLESIKSCLREAGTYDALAQDYEKLYEANKDIEQTIALRHSRDDYRRWVKTAGFQITRDVPSTYEGAVMLIHALKPKMESKH